MAPEGKPPLDKKKIFLLVGLGLVIIIIYRQAVLKPAPAPETAPAEMTDTAIPVENAPAAAENTGTAVINYAVAGSTKEPAGESIGQSWGRDPFIGSAGEEASSNPGPTEPVRVTPPKEEDLLELTGIAWYKNKALAVINGQVVHEGEYLYIKGKKAYLVVTILKNRVLLKNNDKTITLRVRGG